MFKRLDYDSVDQKGVHAQLWHPGMNLRDLEKTADYRYKPEIQAYLDQMKPERGFVYGLINALSAAEYWGSNLNGDAFAEASLRLKHGTFVTDGHNYRHHVNRDPTIAYGRPVFSTYNDTMHRVELISKLSEQEAPDIIEMLEIGRLIRVSMGCRVKFDICNICGNKARNRTEYCPHALRQMNRTLPEHGWKKVWVWNPDPVFFDISYVLIPADPTACFLAKVAEPYATPIVLSVDNLFPEERAVAEKEAKVARVTKLSDVLKASTLWKTIPGDGFQGSIEDYVDRVQPFMDETAKRHPIPDEVLDGDPQKVIGSSKALGIVLSPREFQRTILNAVGLEKGIPDTFSPSMAGPSNDPSMESALEGTPDPDLVHRLMHMKDLMMARSGMGRIPEERAKHLSGIAKSPSPKEEADPPKTANQQVFRKVATMYAAYRKGLIKEAFGAALAIPAALALGGFLTGGHLGGPSDEEEMDFRDATDKILARGKGPDPRAVSPASFGQRGYGRRRGRRPRRKHATAYNLIAASTAFLSPNDLIVFQKLGYADPATEISTAVQRDYSGWSEAFPSEKENYE